MKRHRFLLLAPPLLLLTLLTLPTATTGSKYVWNEVIPLKLEIEYHEQTITSLLSDLVSLEHDAPAVYAAPDGWSLRLTCIQATIQPEGVILIADSGYMLPEAFTVWIGDRAFTVYASGQTDSPNLFFDPATGLLTVSASLWEQGITVEAAAVPAEDLPASPPSLPDNSLTDVVDERTDLLADEFHRQHDRNLP